MRLVSFLALAAGAALSYKLGWGMLVLAAAGLAVFVIAFRAHGKVLADLKMLEVEAALLEEKRERAEDRRRRRPLPVAPGVPWPPRPLDDGPELEEAVLDDLNLLTGPRSLFGILDASSTWFGAERLLSMIRRPLRKRSAIEERQEAVKELAERRLSDLLLKALFPLSRTRLDPAPAALAAPPELTGRPALLLLCHLAGTAGPIMLVLSFIDFQYAAPLTLSFLFNFSLVAVLSRRSNSARGRLLLLGPLIDGFARLLAALGRAEPRAGALRRAVETLRAVDAPAAKLRRRLRMLELHGSGILFELWNVLSLWELRLIPGAEALVSRQRVPLEDAAVALGQIEALLSLALPLEEQRGFSMPVPLDAAAPVFEAGGLGHPYLDADGLVLNDLRLDQEAPIAIVTGSNMAGKSTLLKSVGVNVVLAGMGGPVLAREMSWTPLALYSDINVRDSLDDGKSYFAVEVERVERVVRRASEDPFLLAIFDEIFRGTNSAERVAIAMALLSHLRRVGGLYLVATHDLLLAQLEHEIPGVINYHFREEVAEGSMRFDYRLRNGPAPTRNAIRVLEMRGYPPELVREARERLARMEGAAPAPAAGEPVR